MKLTFLGAAQTVTGSKYLLEYQTSKFLIDCGLFQGRKELRERNWQAPPVDPKSLDGILLTHAHLDHSGYIPRLVKSGFKGPIYCSEGTYDLCKILLPDSGYLQEEDANRANRHGYSRHKPALPLYTEEEAEECLRYFHPLPFGRRQTLPGNASFTLHRAGHILGAGFIRIEDGDKSILFSGDLGRLYDPVMKPPEKILQADYVVVESTYGDRLHEKTDPAEELGRIIRETVAAGGTVIIPAFAVGRTQGILYYLYLLKRDKRIPNVPIFLDSPMAINATDLLHKHMDDHLLPAKLCSKICALPHYTRTADDSKALNAMPMPKIIISASGMATGGRVLHHLKQHLPNKNSTIVFAGFQAPGTLGDRLVQGDKEVKIHGQLWPVRARVENLSNMSAHADYEEILTWLGNFQTPPRKVFLTHGEVEAANHLAQKIKEELNWRTLVPSYQYSETLK